ncbi:MAG: TlpA family protein disulfide reductase [Deltaproteobacteria bacterium]|nr:TlpA family protein disulfide reductase [Deltaproteobacteria bacterium]
MRFTRISTLLTSVGLCALVCCGGEPPKPEVGKPAPDFTVTTLGGEAVRLRDLRGRVVFVNLWATWCPPCREEMPSMVRLYQAMRGRGVEIVAVSEDTDRVALEKFVKRYGVTFPVAQDENKRIYGLYRATGVPETHLIDRRGILRHIQIGPFDWMSPQVTGTVEALLKQ